jgi:PAS domain S-box-containing protein
MISRWNLQNQLSLVLWGSAVLAFFLVIAGVGVFHHTTLEKRARQIMEPYAQMIAVGTDAAVAFQDPKRAQEILDTLERNPYILGAEIVLDDGMLLASFGTLSKEVPQQGESMWDGVDVGADMVVLRQTLPRGGRLRLGMGKEQLRRETYQVLWLVGAGMLVLAAATYGQMIVLRRTIVRPITSLTKATELIRRKSDYQHRAPTAGSDEIARLGRSFNAMMDVVREREENLRQLSVLQHAILNNAAYAIISATPEGLITTYNPAAERMLGYTVEEIVGKQTPVIWHDMQEIESRARELTEELGEEIEPGFDVFTARAKRDMQEEAEWTYICKDGSRVPVLLSISALRDQTEQIMGFVGLAYDLSERKKAEQALKLHKDELEHTVQQRTKELMLARDAAEAANKAKSVFLANMSHELRTPLNAILGFSALIGRDPDLSARLQENIAIINRSGEHLLTLINDVLEIAKIEAGKLQLEISSFDFGSMVRDVADMMLWRAKGKGLQLVLEMSSECPRYLKSDEARLRQILINLVGNAVKFTETGTVTIRFGTYFQKGNYLRIEVEDTGPGISEKDQKRLFNPFVQLAEDGVQQGTGLGLTITRQFVGLMKGSISVESTPGKGSRFRVELPIELIDRTDAVIADSKPPGVITGLIPGQPKYRILIAEDQPENQLLLERLMNEIDLEVRLANNGEQCVALYKEWRPDLIWMDMRMPVMNGEEATRRIRELPGGDKVRIVAVTASVFKEEQQKILAAGMDDFVRKPFRFSDVYDCLARQLNLRFQYTAVSTEDSAQVKLTSKMLSGLPDEQRTELRDALLVLDSERIAAVIDGIVGIDAELGATLRRMSEYFDYQAILDALDE